MKKSVKGILGLCGVLVVLGGGLAALKLTEDPDRNSSSESESSEVKGAGVSLIADKSGGSGTISSVKVKNKNGDLDVIIKTPKTEDSAATYTLKGYEDIPLNTSIVGTLPNNVNGLVSNSIVAENCSDTSKYGFDSPQAEVELTYESGQKFSFKVGDTTPTGTDAYFMLSGDDTVYTVSASKMANFSNELFGFVSRTIVEKPVDDEMPIVESLRIERDDIDYDIFLEYDKKSSDVSYTGGTSASHVMMEPVFSYLNPTNSTDVVTGMFGLSADSVYCVHASEADIAQTGLSKPFCKTTMKCDDGSEYVLLMSEPFTNEDSKKMHYAMLEGGNVIYTVSAETAKWGTVMPVDISSKILFGTYVWNIDQLSVKYGDVETEFTITRKEGIEDKDTYSGSDFNVTKDGEAFDDERYRLFYSFLVKASAEEFAFEEELPEDEPMVSIKFHDSFTDVEQTVDFYEYSGLTALIAVNGESRYFCSKSYAETIVENAKRINTGEDYLTTWK